MNTVYKLCGISIKNFNIKSPYMVTNNKIILSHIKYDKSYFVIQTTLCKILKSIPNLIQGKKYYKLGLFFEHFKFNSKIDKFLNKIIEIENFLFKKYIKKFNLSNKVLFRSIKRSNLHNIFFNVTIQINKSAPVLSVYDRDKNSKSVEYISPHSSSINILYLKDIWHLDNKIGFNWILLQTKIFLPFLYIKECLIDDAPDKKNVIKSNNYLKFIKMHKFGVPLSAIRIELGKIGLEYKDFLKSLNGNKQDISLDNKIPKKILIINPNMLKAIKLKKPKKRRLKKKLEEKFVKPKGYQPPSKNQLQNMLKNLKKSKKI